MIRASLSPSPVANSRGILLAILSGVLLALAFWRISLGWFCYFALVPFFFTIRAPRSSFIFGWVAGIAFFSGLLWWLLFLQAEDVSVTLLAAGVVVLIIYLSIYVALFSVILSVARKWCGDIAFLLSPFVWVSLEYSRGLTSLGFPWGTLAYSQAGYATAIQLASLGGPQIISGWIVLINVLLLLSIRHFRNPWRCSLFLVVFAITLLLPLGWGRIHISNGCGPKMRVALLQVNLDPRRVTDRTYKDEIVPVIEKMVRHAAMDGSHLCIMPESALPRFLTHERAYRTLLTELSRDTDIPILTGATRYEYSDAQFHFFNSALFFTPDGTVDHYDKLHPVPFSERLPYDDVIPWLTKIQFGQGSFSPGKEFKVFSPDGASFSVLICFESIFPRLARRFVHEGAEFLVNITNDSWFGDTPGPYQHARMAILRAVETRVAIARCANTGVSMFIDPYGRVTQTTDLFTRTLIVGDIPMVSDGPTLYGRWGEWFSICSLVISAVLLFLMIGREFRSRL